MAALVQPIHDSQWQQTGILSVLSSSILTAAELSNSISMMMRSLIDANRLCWWINSNTSLWPSLHVHRWHVKKTGKHWWLITLLVIRDLHQLIICWSLNFWLKLHHYKCRYDDKDLKKNNNQFLQRTRTFQSIYKTG